MAIFPFNLFQKSLRTGVTPDSTTIDASAWTVDVINALSDDYANAYVLRTQQDLGVTVNDRVRAMALGLN